MRSRKVHSVASLSVAVVAGLCFSVAVFAMEKAKTSQEEVVTAALRAHVAEGLQIDPAAVTIRIMSPLDRVEIGPATAIRHVGAGSPVGRVTFLIGSARVNAEVEAVKEVVVASRFLRRNQLMEQADVVRTAIRLIWPEGRYLEDVDLVVGKRVTRSVPAHFPVTEDALGNPYTIRQGAQITIQYLQGPLKVVALGLAREDGPAGARIRVTNLDSKKELWARVVDGETVQVGP
ncbi:MAG: flagellar basal body P-ring formation protein FlgA [Nitrospirae bacterium]|nr:MAG: flagellar basal body P-ring formation protein FlgA [Nitrospirota bacterium]